MKKEAIFAILIGIIVGLGITFGIYTLKKKTAVSAEDQVKQIEAQATPTPAVDPNQKLLITSPKDESVLTSNSLRASGNAEPNEMVVVLVNDQEYVTQADNIGAFAIDLQLETGGNVIQFIAIGTDGKQTTLTQNVVVSSASFDEKVPTEDETKEASDSAKSTDTKTTPTPTKKPLSTPKPSATPKDQ